MSVFDAVLRHKYEATSLIWALAMSVVGASAQLSWESFSRSMRLEEENNCIAVCQKLGKFVKAYRAMPKGWAQLIEFSPASETGLQPEQRREFESVRELIRISYGSDLCADAGTPRPRRVEYSGNSGWNTKGRLRWALEIWGNEIVDDAARDVCAIQ